MALSIGLCRRYSRRTPIAVCALALFGLAILGGQPAKCAKRKELSNPPAAASPAIQLPVEKLDFDEIVFVKRKSLH